jgi:hypothetical protein
MIGSVPRACAAAVVAFLVGAARADQPAVEFNRDIRPILSDYCFHCHGPDGAKRKAGLRLDTEKGSRAERSGAPAVVPGKPEASELYRRLTAADEHERMPPKSIGRRPSKDQIEAVRRWIAAGGRYQPHWAFIPPERPEPPTVKDAARVRNAIDAFILARLEREGLTPGPEADRVTLIRRLSLDLTGLPPTPEQVDAFLADRSPDAYERLVDRLSASPRYGERMAIGWLDAARYADTNGYQDDGERQMWRWRDWVIDAYNRNLPFDQFTVEQIAGDLLPAATLEQKIATGFNRNHRINAEGGLIPEEFAVEYVADRVETAATVWLGLTMTCCRCHDHKYDPVSQRDYYSVFAYFNNVPESGRGFKYGNSPPVLRTPTVEQAERLAAWDARVAEAERRLAAVEPQIAAALAEWEKTAAAAQSADWGPTRKAAAHFAFNGDAGNEVVRVKTPQGEKRVAGVFENGPAAYVAGRVGRAAEFDGRRFLNAGNLADFGFSDKFTLAAWVYPVDDRGGVILSRTPPAARSAGWSLVLEDGRLQLNLVQRWLDDALRVQTQRRLQPGRWHHLAASYDGTKLASGVRFYVDGRPEPLVAQLDALNQTFKTREPLRIGSNGAADGGFRGLIDEVRVYHDVLEPAEVEHLAVPEGIAEIVGLPSERRSPAQAGKLRACYLDRHAPAAMRQAAAEPAEVRRRRAAFLETVPTTMVMQELPSPRPTHLLIRGQYDKPGEAVTAGVPAALGPLPAGAPPNRLGLAQWLVRPDHPLTARVAVNRLWQMLFGEGLVKTVDDFGSQAEPPTHPELLDWLATEYVRLGWDTKAMIKLIVCSATYRQSSIAPAALPARDPENRLYARGPRYRLSAEIIRDQALAASGLLVEKIGGPSVKPYQPAGLWTELTGGADYVPDTGEKLYRRSLYTFWKRTAAPPTLVAFDAAGRETCVVRRTQTNTPLQALTLLNDVTFVEAARKLAERAMLEGGESVEGRIGRAFRLVLSRAPGATETKVLAAGFERHRAHFAANPAAAEKLLAAGESKRNPRLSAVDLAALAAVCNVILNLDEAITKE